MRVRDIYFQGQQTDRHGTQLTYRQCPREILRSSSSFRMTILSDRHAVASARICFCMEKHSSTSPTLMSLKFETPMPHSKPERTSLASSLKRRSELTRPV